MLRSLQRLCPLLYEAAGNLPHQQHVAGPALALVASSFAQRQPSLPQWQQAAQYAKKAKASKDASQSSASTTSGTSSSSAPAAETLDFKSLFNPCRYRTYYENVLQRELMIKCNSPTWDLIPRPRSVVLTIHTSDTRLNQTTADKAELLLYKLALEHVAQQPADFVAPPNRHHSGKADGVTTTLTGNRMYDFLEKLVYVVLPNQMGFEGVPNPEVDEDLTKLQKVPAPGLHVVEFKVSNLLLYPDFEQNFDLFEPLRSMQVKVVIENARNPQDARLLLTGLGLPVL